MLQNKDIETLRMLFCSHNYVMTTAELTASKLYYADIKQLLDEGLIERVRRGYYHWTQDNGGKAKLSLSIDCFPMQYFVWRPLFSIIDTVTEILANGSFCNR